MSEVVFEHDGDDDGSALGIDVGEKSSGMQQNGGAYNQADAARRIPVLPQVAVCACFVCTLLLVPVSATGQLGAS
eukprot:1161592-Pelagomonas_calceolata.AAC.2